MSLKIIFKHLSGRKRGTNEVYPLSLFAGQLRVGRDPICEVRFDPIADTCVSRHHAAIQWDDSEPRTFILSDLLSSNGTIINGRRLDGSTELKDGDVVEFGQGGPTVRIEFGERHTGGAQVSPPATGLVPKVKAPPAELTMKHRALSWHRK